MKPHLTSIHEAMHAASAAVFLCQFPNVRDVRVFLHIGKGAESDGQCGILLPDHLRLAIPEATLGAWMACGPLGQHLGPNDIGRAIADRRFDDFMSVDDIEKASRIGAIDQFIAATAAHLWRSRIDTVALHKALTCDDMRLHQPLIPLDAICPGRLAAKVKAEAKASVPRYLPANACVGRAA